MPQYIPPQTTVPADWLVTQNQEQDQYQNQELPVNINDTNQANTNAESEVYNENRVEGVQHNTQINNSHSGYYQYERGVRMPTATLGLSGWADNYSHGGTVTLTIPLGGSKGKYAKRQIVARAQEIEIANVTRQLEACANIDAAGFIIKDLEALGLGSCQYLAKKPTHPVAQVQDASLAYKQQLNEMQMVINQLLQRIDELQQEKGTEFRTNG